MRFHALVRELGGSDGVRSEQMLASSVFQAQQSAFGEDAYATVPEKAAAYAFFLIQNHPFIDANKRTAELTMMAFFDLNGYKFVEDGLVHCRDTNGSPRGSSQDLVAFRAGSPLRWSSPNSYPDIGDVGSLNR